MLNTYTVLIKLECGTYYYVASGNNPASALDSVLAVFREKYCEHAIIGTDINLVSDTPHRLLYHGCCAFGA